jgi:type VI secretion system protein ImpA
MNTNTATLLAPVDGRSPCGPDLRGSLAFAELQRMARGRPAQYVGDKLVVPAEDPPWPAVVQAATGLLARSKDLRVAVLLTRGLVATGGWAGLASGMALVRDLLGQFWAEVHPRLDDEEGGGEPDATLRLNSLAELGSDEVLAALRALPIVSAARAGRISLRERTTAPLLEAAMAEVGAPVVRTTLAAIEHARQATLDIERLLADQLGARAITFARLTGLLVEAAAMLNPRTIILPPAEVAVEAPVVRAAAIPTTVGSRVDVARALEEICRFYRAHEPSSPIPLLLERARRLVDKSFAELVEDLMPEGMGQLELLRGSRNNSSNPAE